MKYDLAKELNAKMLQHTHELNRFLLVIQDECAAEEFQHYRMAVGKILGYMFLDIMEPIYKEFPSLEPPEFKDE